MSNREEQSPQALVVVNPQARRVGSPRETGERIRCLLAARGLRCRVEHACAAAAARRAVRRALLEGFSPVIAAGGDGTLNHVAGALAGSGVPLGIIPLGTSNSLAWGLGLRPGDLEAACAVITGGAVRTLDLGLINGRTFVGAADIGLGALVQSRLTSSAKRSLGVYSFLHRLPRALIGARPWCCEVVLDGRPRTERLWAAFLCNSRQYVWRLRLGLEIIPDDGQLDVILLQACTRRRLLQLATAVVVGGRPPAEVEELEVLRARAVELRAAPPALWDVDGEVSGRTPVSCRVHAGALRLLVPAGSP